MGALRLAAAAPREDDQAGIAFCGGGQRQEVLAVTGDDDEPFGPGIGPDLLVWGFQWEHLAQAPHLMVPVAQKQRDILWQIVIEEKPHPKFSLICSATRASISTR